MQNVIWRHIGIRLPDEWEMLLYSSQLESGRCVFADRYQHRLEMSWQIVPGPPDFSWMMKNYAERLGAKSSGETSHEGTADIRMLDVDGWHGLVCADNVISSRFGRYISEEHCLVELVFLWENRRDKTLERTILNSIDLLKKDQDGLRRWRAFGMDIHVPDRLPLAQCAVLPASAQMVFRDGKKPDCEEKFERLGFVSEWLQVSLEKWLQQRTPRDISGMTHETTRIKNHEFVILRGHKSMPGVSRLLGRHIDYQSIAWICPNDNRLYCHTSLGSQPIFVPLRLQCCPEVEVNA